MMIGASIHIIADAADEDRLPKMGLPVERLYGHIAGCRLREEESKART